MQTVEEGSWLRRFSYWSPHLCFKYQQMFLLKLLWKNKIGQSFKYIKCGWNYSILYIVSVLLFLVTFYVRHYCKKTEFYCYFCIDVLCLINRHF